MIPIHAHKVAKSNIKMNDKNAIEFGERAGTRDAYRENAI